MKHVSICMLALVAFFAFADNVEGVAGYSNIEAVVQIESGEDFVSGVKTRPTRAPIDNATLPNPDDPTSDRVHSSIMQPIESRKPESFSGWSRWYNDLLVYDGAVGSGQDFDEDPNTSDIYAAFDTDHTTDDTIYVFKSTNTGATWSEFFIGTNLDGRIDNPKVRVFERGGQTWVAFIGIWYEPSGEKLLYSRRVLSTGGTATWEQVDDSVSTADLDAEAGTNAWLYCTYMREEPSYDVIYAARNDASGSGWEVDWLFDNPELFPYPEIAAGVNGNVGVAFIDDRITADEQVRIKRSTDYGATWISSEQVSNTPYPLSFTDIAYSYSSTYDPSGWIFVTYDVSGIGEGDNLGYYYTTNGGVAWTYGGVIGGTNDDENMGTVRSRKIGGSVTLAYNQDVGAVGDSTMFSWAQAYNPTNFITPVRINDYSATGYWPPCAGWITSGGGYSAILYTSWTQSYNCYLDWFGNVGVSENTGTALKTGILSLAPNPAKGISQMSFAVRQDGRVRVTLYDITGRLVRNLIDQTMSAGEHSVNIEGRTLAAGVYLVKVATPDGVDTKTMTIVR